MSETLVVIIWFISENLRFLIGLVELIKTFIKEKIRRIFDKLAD